MPNRSNQPFGLPRLAALFSLILLLVGQGSTPLQQGGPGDEPPPDAPTPAMLRAEHWAAEPAAPAPGYPEIPEAVDPAMAINYLCGYSARSVEFSTITYAHFADSDSDWEIRAGNICQRSTQKRITNNNASDYEPQLSSDASQVVFVSNRDGDAEIYSAALADAKNVRLTRSKSTDTMPAFSPDGEFIAFVSDRSGYAEIYTMHKDGTGVTQITDFHMLALHPDWSPDGSKIVFTLSNGREGQIVVMDWDGKNKRALTHILPYLGRVRWSPSGKKLAFEYFADQNMWLDLGVVNADGSSLHKVAGDSNAYDYELGSWSVDEKYLIFNKLHYVYSSLHRRWFLETAWNICLVLADRSEVNLGGFGINTPLYGAFINLDVVNGDRIAPISRMGPIPDWVRETSMFYYSFWGKDDGPAGLLRVGALYQVNDSTARYSAGTIDPNGAADARYSGYYISVNGGKKYAFSTYSEDRAGNIDPYPAEPDETFWGYSLKAEGQVLDMREHPLANAQVETSPAAMNKALTDGTGNGTLYMAVNQEYQAQFSHAGIGALPPQTWPRLNHCCGDGYDMSFLAVLPGNDEQVTNGQFTGSSQINGWLPSAPGAVSVVTGGKSGSAAQVSPSCGAGFCVDEEEMIGPSPSAEMVLDSQGPPHVVTLTGAYSTRGSSGDWQSGEALPEGEYSGLVAAPDGTLYIVQTSTVVQIFRKTPGGAWSALAPLPVAVTYAPGLVVDLEGKLTAFYTFSTGGYYQTGLYAVSLGDGGAWEPPRLLDMGVILDAQPYARLAEDGSLFVVYRDSINALAVARIFADGSLKCENIQSDIFGSEYDHPRLAISPGGDIFIAARYLEGGVSTNHRFVYRFNFRLAAGSWNGYTVLHRGQYTTEALSTQRGWGGIELDTQGNLHVALLNLPAATENLLYMVRPGDGGGKWVTDKATLVGSPGSLAFTLDANDRGLLLAGGADGLFYQAVHYDNQAGVSSLSQSIHIPETMHKPTLSFFYRLDPFMAGSASSMEALLLEEGQEPVLLLSHAGATSGWKHAWADLTPWQGKDITVQFRLNQPQGEYPARLLVDEVTASSWKSPLLRGVAPNQVSQIPPEGVWIELEGENLMAGSRVFAGSLEAEVVEFDVETGKLRALLSPTTQMGEYDVRVVAPGGADETLKRALRVGEPQFLPVVVR